MVYLRDIYKLKLGLFMKYRQFNVGFILASLDSMSKILNNGTVPGFNLKIPGRSWYSEVYGKENYNTIKHVGLWDPKVQDYQT